jgi:hypothetical protein
MGYNNPEARTVKADTMDNKYAGFGEAKKQEITNLVKEARASTAKAFSGYNAGGLVPGIGSSDKIPANLTPGEFVIRKAMANKYGLPLLEAINMGAFKMPNMSQPKFKIGSSEKFNSKINGAKNSETMYNNTYNVNVNVSGTNASPDDIANVVMAKLSQQNRGNLRSSNY